jgi:hypothetical protein
MVELFTVTNVIIRHCETGSSFFFPVKRHVNCFDACRGSCELFILVKRIEKVENPFAAWHCHECCIYRYIITMYPFS